MSNHSLVSDNYGLSGLMFDQYTRFVFEIEYQLDY